MQVGNCEVRKVLLENHREWHCPFCQQPVTGGSRCSICKAELLRHGKWVCAYRKTTVVQGRSLKGGKADTETQATMIQAMREGHL